MEKKIKPEIVARYNDYLPEFFDKKEIHGDSISEFLVDELPKWNTSEPVLIEAPTGSGKTTFVYETLIPDALKNHKNILLVSNRIALNLQQKKDILKKFYPKELRLYTDVGLQEKDDYGAIHIVSYQSLISHLKNPEFQDWIRNIKYAVFDEAHFFSSDSYFNSATYLILKTLLQKLSHVIRIYMTATSWDILWLLSFAEGEIPSCAHYFINGEKVKNKNRCCKYYYKKADYQKYQLHFIDDLTAIYPKISEHPDEKWMIFISSKIDGIVLCNNLFANRKALKLKDDDLIYFDADYKRGLYSTKNPTLDTFWGTLIFEERFKQRILVTTSVLDCGINVKDDALTNIVIGTSDRTEFIQMLGRKRINSKTKKIDVWVLRPSERSLRKWKRKYKEVIALADERLAAQNIGEKLGIAWRVWNHPDPLAHALFYPSTDGILEVNLTAMVTYERRHYFLEQLLREPLSDVHSRFEQLVISWLGLRPEDVDQTIEKTQTERLNNLSTFLEHNVGKAMTESQKEEFIQLLTIALELANVKSSVRNRSMGSSACSNRLKDLGLPYMIKPKSGVWTIEEKD